MGKRTSLRAEASAYAWRRRLSLPLGQTRSSVNAPTPARMQNCAPWVCSKPDIGMAYGRDRSAGIKRKHPFLAHKKNGFLFHTWCFVRVELGDQQREPEENTHEKP